MENRLSISRLKTNNERGQTVRRSEINIVGNLIPG